MATEERTVSGKFYGIEPPSALVKRDDNNNIMPRSRVDSTV
jgi:hypothetical protein